MRTFISILILAGTLSAQLPQDDKRLVFSTFQGGKSFDDAQAVAVDKQGFIYVTGESESSDLPSTPVGGKPLTAAVAKGYLTKYSADGQEVLWRLLLGGSSNTVPHALALDNDGNVYVAGTTGARDFPLLKPVQDKQPGLNICFLMKFDPDGKLQFSTYFGGERNEEANALAVDSKGNIYMAGRATSTTLPVKNALQPKISGGGQDSFIAKYTPDYQLAWATYLGGTAGTDNIYAIAIGPDDSLFVTGETMSPGMATKDAYIEKVVSYSSYVAKIAADGSGISYFTYVGWKGGYTTTQAIAVDALGRAYITGNTSSKELPVTEKAIQSAFGGGHRDAFLLRLNPEGTAADYLTYLGGSYVGPSDPDETASSVRIDRHGHVYIAGETSSPDFPGSRALQTYYGGAQDAYVIRLDIDNGQIIYSTLWGGGKKDRALAVALGPGEAVTVVGESYSADLPVARAQQAKLVNNNDAFIAQICDPWLGAYPSASFRYVTGGELPAPQTIEVYSGCKQSFETTAFETDQPWLTAIPDAKSVGMKVRLEVNVDGLTPGIYEARIRVTVPAAFLPTLEIPVVVVVEEPVP